MTCFYFTEYKMLEIPSNRLSSEYNLLARNISPLPFLSRAKSDSNPNLTHPPVATHHGLHNHHILTVDMFSKEQLNEIFNLAQTLRVYVLKERPLDHILKVSKVRLDFFTVLFVLLVIHLNCMKKRFYVYCSINHLVEKHEYYETTTKLRQ